MMYIYVIYAVILHNIHNFNVKFTYNCIIYFNKKQENYTNTKCTLSIYYYLFGCIVSMSHYFKYFVPLNF